MTAVKGEFAVYKPLTLRVRYPDGKLHIEVDSFETNQAELAQQLYEVVMALDNLNLKEETT